MPMEDGHNDPLIKSAIEYEIANETRTFLRKQRLENQNLSIRPLAFQLTGIAAAIVVLVLSIISLNLSLSPHGISERYPVENFMERSTPDDNLSKLLDIKLEYENGFYNESLEKILTMKLNPSVLNDHKEWLQVLNYLQLSPKYKEELNLLLQKIRNKPNHIYHNQAIKMSKSLNTPLQFLVVKK